MPIRDALDPAPYLSPEYRVRAAREDWEWRQARALRRRVFCDEQGLFDPAGGDTDPVDRHASRLTLVAVDAVFGMPDTVVGTVRLHEARPGEWHGSRLAVDPGHRRVAALGTALIRLAVGTARARGATRFLARVQSQNAALFHRLHWETLAEISVRGRPHHLMRADLARYAPSAPDAAGFIAVRRAA